MLRNVKDWKTTAIGLALIAGGVVLLLFGELDPTLEMAIALALFGGGGAAMLAPDKKRGG